MIMDMKPIRRLTASLLRHRAAPWLCALAVLALTSCGDFFEFDEERATWDGKIICQNDSSVVMVGTYIRTNRSVRVNIRLLHTPSNEVLAMGTATVPITDDLRPLVREPRPGDGLAPTVSTRLQ